MVADNGRVRGGLTGLQSETCSFTLTDLYINWIGWTELYCITPMVARLIKLFFFLPEFFHLMRDSLELLNMNF